MVESGEPAIFLPSTNQVISRPNSLLGPEKEPVNFSINLIDAPPEVEQLVDHIKSVAEQFLYHWKTFPISEWTLFDNFIAVSYLVSIE